MNNITNQDAFIFMKVGDHAGETFDQILERKRKELNSAGKIFWGYGGRSCHPIQQVQPFVQLQLKRHNNIYLLMQSVHSTADPDIEPATEYSKDGINWERIPDGIEVIGSRYALVLGDIEPGDLELSLENFEVGIGPSRGKAASKYIQGRIDKACLVVSENFHASDSVQIPISFKAPLLEPYAVLLR